MLDARKYEDNRLTLEMTCHRIWILTNRNVVYPRDKHQEKGTMEGGMKREKEKIHVLTINTNNVRNKINLGAECV